MDAAIIYVCITCRRVGEPDEPRPGALLAVTTAAAAQGSGVEVKHVACLANCTRGASAAMRANGSWTYVFGGLDPGCGAALIDGAGARYVEGAVIAAVMLFLGLIVVGVIKPVATPVAPVAMRAH